ncbi:multidrug ABC transporter ATP-binding protein [Reticulibacter mediterranei]|uniref:Multidrug ABC transporter ATP-binding protein n=1 Tax=Reticulibacter mediterranei TaxID=2778369 RepID=A0A8J3N2A2_9CHLR|nr:ABC transporter ATP-binding protein [Reticulibacter mediterranei]GHO92980.1 multidrug ABC transporter ATP-binding protein [Reticulibacter mediterranei]
MQDELRTNQAGNGSPIQPVATLQGVYKRFESVEALRGVNLAIFPGEIVALLGPNGAGKTTALNVLLGRRSPDRGKVRLFGDDPHKPEGRRWIGATPQEISFPPTLTIAEIVDLVQAHYPEPLASQEVLERFGLMGLERRQAGGLSGGQRRRLAIALAFVGNPRAVFLDEPTTGLDVEARRELWQVVRVYASSGGSVLLTTHYLEEIEALADHVVLLHRGMVLIEGSVDAIKARVGLKQIRFTAPDLPELPNVARVVKENQRYCLYAVDADAVVRELVRQSCEFHELEVLPTSLEDAFLVLTGDVH